jgi:hypothetical protein
VLRSGEGMVAGGGTIGCKTAVCFASAPSPSPFGGKIDQRGKYQRQKLACRLLPAGQMGRKTVSFSRTNGQEDSKFSRRMAAQGVNRNGLGSWVLPRPIGQPAEDTLTAFHELSC